MGRLGLTWFAAGPPCAWGQAHPCSVSLEHTAALGHPCPCQTRSVLSRCQGPGGAAGSSSVSRAAAGAAVAACAGRSRVQGESRPHCDSATASLCCWPAPESLCWHGSPSPAWARTDWAVQLCRGGPSTSPGRCDLAGCPAVSPPQQLPMPCVTWSSSKATCVARGARVSGCRVQGAHGLRMDQRSQWLSPAGACLYRQPGQAAVCSCAPGSSLQRLEESLACSTPCFHQRSAVEAVSALEPFQSEGGDGSL